MPRTHLAVAGAALTLVLAPTAFAAQGFSYGVAAGDITPRSAILWGKADKAGTYGLEVADKRGFRRGGVAAFLLKANEADDFTLQRRVRGLKPGSRRKAPGSTPRWATVMFSGGMPTPTRSPRAD
jgi:alkaline phosphatase D